MTENEIVNHDRIETEDKLEPKNEFIYTRQNNQVVTIKKTKENVTNKVVDKKKIPYLKIILFSSGFLLVGIIICVLIVVLKKKKKLEVQEDFSFNDAKEIIGFSIVEENHKLIKESLSEVTESIKVIENSRLNFDPIIYDSSSLIIPEVLKDLMDEKSKIVEEDIQMYNNKFGELSEKINEFTAMVSQSIKEMPSSLKNLKNEIMNISEVFEETIKEICYPLVLQQQISKNKKSE